ncbi:MAG: TIGR00270 family protein [Candidatus Micrarchaeota archaeon]|nr:TIGR00270 family protein [Candidatus Micrarchaeota archaeon]
MEECEICGIKAGDIYIVDVEDVELRVCTKCARGKKVVSQVIERPGFGRKRVAEGNEDEPQLIENYGSAIHSAREAMKIPLKVLAEMLNEKETLLLRIEQQRTLPSVELTKKLEKALAIRLMEKGQQGENPGASRGSRDRATLGDFIKDNR